MEVGIMRLETSERHLLRLMDDATAEDAGKKEREVVVSVEPIFVGYEDAARLIGISVGELQKKVGKGEIFALRHRRPVLIEVAELRRWAAEQVEAEKASRLPLPRRGRRRA